MLHIQLLNGLLWAILPVTIVFMIGMQMYINVYINTVLHSEV